MKSARRRVARAFLSIEDIPPATAGGSDLLANIATRGRNIS